MDAELEFAIQPNTTGKQLFDQVGFCELERVFAASESLCRAYLLPWLAASFSLWSRPCQRGSAAVNTLPGGPLFAVPRRRGAVQSSRAGASPESSGCRLSRWGLHGPPGRFLPSGSRPGCSGGQHGARRPLSSTPCSRRVLSPSEVSTHPSLQPGNSPAALLPLSSWKLKVTQSSNKRSAPP